MPDLTEFNDQPKIDQLYKFNVLEIYQLWESAAKLNYYLDQDPEAMPLSPFHPLMRIHMTIQEQVDELITVGMTNGFIIWPLLELKKLITPEDDGDVQE